MEIKGDRQKHRACVGESCLSSWLGIQSFAPSICQAPSLVATLRARAPCRFLSGLQLFSDPDTSHPLRRSTLPTAEEAGDRETRRQALPCYSPLSVYIQQINANAAGGYAIRPGVWTRRQLALTSRTRRKKGKANRPPWLQTHWWCHDSGF